MLMKILIVLPVIVAGLVVVVATRRSEYRVARTTTISAPPPMVSAQVNDFHRWGAWNPWANVDPAMKQTYEGAPAGIGAIYTWAGNREVRQGRMTKPFDHGGQEQFRGQGHSPLHEHGQDDRWQFREGAGGHEVGGGREGRVKYMLLICRDEQVWDTLSLAERQQIYADTVKIQDELTARGQYLAGHPLHPSSSATSVRVRDGKRLVTDGPFAETREQLGGYMLIDVTDLDDAIAIAGRIPLARTSTAEVRPVRDGAPTS